MEVVGAGKRVVVFVGAFGGPVGAKCPAVREEVIWVERGGGGALLWEGRWFCCWGWWSLGLGHQLGADVHQHLSAD